MFLFWHQNTIPTNQNLYEMVLDKYNWNLLRLSVTNSKKATAINQNMYEIIKLWTNLNGIYWRSENSITAKESVLLFRKGHFRNRFDTFRFGRDGSRRILLSGYMGGLFSTARGGHYISKEYFLCANPTSICKNYAMACQSLVWIQN